MIKNAKTLPEVFYGLHMVEGTAEYAEPGTNPFRIFIGESTIKNMNPTFQGKPVYVDHVDEVDLANIQTEADGYVIESFYNRADGKNWVKFLVVSDRGKEAIRMGWKLSNAYIPNSFAGGGQCHGVDYLKEVTGGEYEHLAIVQNPRYEESIILTPEEFKSYNGEKELELVRLANSKDKPKEKTQMKLNIWKKTKVENSIDSDMMVDLEKSKKQMSLGDIVTKYDAILNMNGYANGDHMVKVGDGEMSVNDLVKKHIEMQNKMMENDGEGEPGEDIEDEAMENGDDEDSTISEAQKDVGDRGGDKSLDNEEDEDDMKKKKMNSAKIANAKKVALAKEKARSLKNARPGDAEDEVAPLELSSDKVARGINRYGSN